MSDALYEQRRDLSNLMQKLEDQGYTIPSSNEVTGNSTNVSSVSAIDKASRITASTNSKGQAMINTAVSNRPAVANSISTNAGYTITDTVKNALLAGGYIGIEGTGGRVINSRQQVYAPRQQLYVKGNDKIVKFGTGTYIDENGNTQVVENVYEGTWDKEKLVSEDNVIYRKFITVDGKEYFLNQEDNSLIPWHQSANFESDVARFKEAYENWKALPSDERPATWYAMLEYDSSYSPMVYNEMVTTNFDTTKLQKWFNSNAKKIIWKQSVKNTVK